MSDRDHEPTRDDLAAYLLGALEPDEAAGLKRHLAGCEECRADLEWLRPAVALLPESVERHEPPAQLRERVLAEARSDAAARATTGRPEPRGRRFAALRPLAGLAAAAAVVAIATITIVSAGSGGAGRTTIVAGRPPGVTARVTMEGDSASLRLANVHQLPPGRVLEAWVRREGRVVPVRSLFVPDREGRAGTPLPRMDGVDTVMVTAEPRGGSNVPTSTPMVSLAIPQ
jgi:anti-sigma-K factor RskA